MDIDYKAESAEPAKRMTFKKTMKFLKENNDRFNTGGYTNWLRSEYFRIFQQPAPKTNNSTLQQLIGYEIQYREYLEQGVQMPSTVFKRYKFAKIQKLKLINQIKGITMSTTTTTPKKATPAKKAEAPTKVVKAEAKATPAKKADKVEAKATPAKKADKVEAKKADGYSTPLKPLGKLELSLLLKSNNLEKVGNQLLNAFPDHKYIVKNPKGWAKNALKYHVEKTTYDPAITAKLKEIHGL